MTFVRHLMLLRRAGEELQVATLGTFMIGNLQLKKMACSVMTLLHERGLICGVHLFEIKLNVAGAA